MKRPVKVCIATVSITVLMMAAVATPAGATAVPTGATASSMPAYTGSASLTTSLALTGSLGGLLNGLISPIVNQVLNPLVAALQGTLNTVVASTLGVSGSNVAGSPSVQAIPAPGAFPTDLPGGLPSPCTTSSTAKPCYSGTGVSLSLPLLVSLGVGALRGYTQQSDTSVDPTNSIFGRAQIASATVSVLPGLPSIVSPLVSLGAVDAKANCPATSAAPTASVSAANIQLLGNAVTVGIANGAIGTITVSGTAYTLSTLPSLAVAGFTLSSYGTALKLTIPLGVTAILSAIGLSGSAVNDLISSALPGTTLSLSVIIGPNSQVTSTSAQAWGLGIGVDLSGTLGFNLLGLVGATISIPSGVGGGNYGDLLDVRLGYASCTKPSSNPSGSVQVVPPALI
jgi:hypothetical protein